VEPRSCFGERFALTFDYTSCALDRLYVLMTCMKSHTSSKIIAVSLAKLLIGGFLTFGKSPTPSVTAAEVSSHPRPCWQAYAADARVVFIPDRTPWRRARKPEETERKAWVLGIRRYPADPGDPGDQARTARAPRAGRKPGEPPAAVSSLGQGDDGVLPPRQAGAADSCIIHAHEMSNTSSIMSLIT
jgi:hypothetical protein